MQRLSPRFRSQQFFAAKYAEKLFFFRNSGIVYYKTKNPFGTKILKNISFQLLLHIIKVKHQEDQQQNVALQA